MWLAAFSSNQTLRLSDRAKYRLLEMLPGVLVWSTFIVAAALSFWQPRWVIVFIILFDLYWFIRAIYVLVYLLIAYRRYRRTVVIDWLQKAERTAGWDRIYHLVLVPVSAEPYQVLVQSFRALAQSKFPLERLLVVLACEERFPQTRQYAAGIHREFGHRFGGLLVNFHPANIPGEIAGKGANITWAGKSAVKKFIAARKIPYADVVVTTLDVDSIVHPQYFAYLTWVYLHHPDRLRTSYQPLAFYHNNIWQSPALTRVVAISTTFWLMTETIRPDRLFTFSSHSMPLQALVDVGFWQNDIVTEDSRIFLQCFLEYDGDYRVTPLYLPISMDTVATQSFWRTVVNQYKQQRRWAYGVENFPYMVWNFITNQRIGFGKKLKYVWNQLEGVYSWATAPILIFVLGWLPVSVAQARGNTTLIVQSAPHVLQTLMTLATVGLIAGAVISTILLPPPPPARRRFLGFLPMLLQWVLFPVTMIIFGSIPATDAQTRLMLGKYLGFWVTEKTRQAE
ncbi:MAG: glycosyltransferase family 2 protein [Candidatus Kerfeldbacteria bacterium]|nr:glycosyltransferase family 2 protein [Candidatus Kerfeldbacteria bacterium]